jgi:asparagine synthase (glutamine-hydrolysing)
VCGIAGFIDHELSLSQSKEIINEMLEKISHRGPDARDTFFELPLVFGHNRLSIIDLSDDGIQPMDAFDSVIIFNGEIYNYLEVREELQKQGKVFKTQSDTEVILAAYQHYGSDCVKHFIGMWAFALWDKKKKLLFCSRDRFGIKPFNYISKNNRFYFASEYKALKVTPVFSSDINEDQLFRGLQLGWITYNHETYFNCIHSLPPASNLILKDGRISIEKYWDIDLNKKFTGSDEEKINHFKKLFEDSIKLHMRADVEVGGCLSGGLDSSAIASAVSLLFPEINFKTFTIYYEGSDGVDERPWVKEVTSKYPALKNYTYSPDENEINEGFLETLKHADVPIAGSSPVSQYFVMKLAKQHNLKVLLDGQGSDEYLAGYMHSFYRLFGGLLAKFKLLEFGREFSTYSNIHQFSLKKKTTSFALSVLSSIKSEPELYSVEYKKYYPFLPLAKNNTVNLQNKVSDSRLNSFLYQLVFHSSLPSLLHYEDRNSMAFSIESRVPFLDHRLVEFVFSLGDSDKLHQGMTKRILRSALNGILPETISQRVDKKGFVTPGEIKWLKGPLNYLLSQKMEIPSINNNTLQNELKLFNEGYTKNANLVWRAVVLNHWLKAACVA